MNVSTSFGRALLCPSLAVALTVLASVSAGLAQSSYTWNGGATPDGNWSNGSNWGGSGPANPQAILNFAGSTQTAATNNFTGGSAGHRVLFNSGASSFTLAGNSITFYDYSSNIPKLENSSANLQTVSFPFINGNSGGIEINPVSGDLTLSGTVDNGGYEVDVWGGNSKMLTLGNTVSGAGKLVLKQYSKVKIAGASTWTGNTEIDTGEFWLGSGGTFASNSVVYVGNGGQAANTAKLWIEGSSGTLTNPITVNAGNYGTRVIGGLNTSGTATFLGNLTLNGPVNLEANQAGGTVVFAGLIGSANTVTKTGPGTVNLSGDLSGYSGNFTNSAGTGIKSGGTAMGGTLTVAAGTISIQNTVANTYSAVNLNGGFLRIKSNNNALGTANLGIGGNATLATESGSSAVTLTNSLVFGGTQTLSIDSGYSSLALNGPITASGATLQTTSSGTTTLGGSVNLGTGTLSVPGGQTLTIAAPASVTADNVALSGTTAANILNITGGTVSTKFLNIGNGSSTSGRVNQSGGTVTVSTGGSAIRVGHWANGANPGSSYTLTGGTLDTTAVTATVSWDGAGAVTVGGGAGAALWKVAQLNWDGGGADTALGTVTVTNNGTLETYGNINSSSVASEGLYLHGGTVSTVGTTASRTWATPIYLNSASNAVVDVSPSNTVTASGLISGSGTGKLVKYGAGTLTLSGSNSFAGGLIVSNGAVNVQRSNALGTATATVISGAELELQGGIGPVNTAVSITGSGTNSTGALRNVSGNNSFGATITLAGATRINSDSGTLTLNLGNLLNVGGNALTVGGAGTVAITNFTGSAGSSLTNDGTGTCNFTGSYRGSTIGSGTNMIVRTGTLQFSSGYFNSSPIGFGALNVRVEPGGTLKFSSSHSIGGDNIDGGTSWGVIRVAGGKLDVSGSQYIRGGTASGLGRLILDGASVIGTSDLRTVDGGSTISTIASASPSVLFCSGGVGVRGTLTLDVADGAAANDLVVSNALIASTTGGITKSGAGIALLLGTNSFSGGAIVSAGKLSLGATGVMTNTSSITVSNGAIYDVSAVSGYALTPNQTLKGNGTVVGAVNVLGTLSPGASIGTLTLGNAPTLAGTALVEVNQTNSQNADLLTLTSGTLTYGGNLTLTNLGPVITNGAFTLFSSAGGYAGVFSTLTLPQGGAAHWNTNNLVVDGSIAFTNNNPVANNLTVGVALGGTVTLPVIGGKNSPADVDGDSISVTAVGTPSSGSASFTSSSVTYVASGSTGTNTFTYTVTDLAGGTDTKTVTAVVTSPQGFNQVSAGVDGGNAVLQYLGVPGTNYALEITHALPATNWAPVITSPASPSGFLYYTNPISLAPTNDYYRTRYIP